MTGAADERINGRDAEEREDEAGWEEATTVRSPHTRSRRSLRLCVAAVRVFALLLAMVQASRAEDAPKSPPDVYAAVPAKLRELGRWCGDARLGERRAVVAEALLLFDPDDADARAWLGQRPEGKDQWGRDPQAKPPLDLAKEALPEWDRRRAALAADVLATARPAVTSDPKTARLRDRVRRAVAALVPEEARARELAGEVKSGGRWVLRETAAAAEGRKRLERAATDAKRSTAKLKFETSAEAEWVTTLKLGKFEVRSMYARSQTEDVALGMIRARELLARALQLEPPPLPEFQVRIFADYWSCERYVKKHTRLTTDDQRKRALQGASHWIGNEELICRDTDDEPHRLDGLVRQAISTAKLSCGRMYLAADWMGEGVGMYVTYLLLGTRFTVFTQRADYSDELAVRELATTRADWVSTVRGMVERGYDPKVPELVGAPLVTLSRDDGLVAYALAAYFLQTRPADAAKLIARTQGKVTFHQALAEICDMDAEGLEHRFLRWLRETK